MINAKALLADLTRLLKGLESDLRSRIEDLPDLRASLHHEWKTARDANRSAEPFESWSEQVITQAGVHWLLSCVFLRFIEDNLLVERPWISGPAGDRLGLARDRHESYFRDNPTETDRDYLISCFRDAGRLPGLVTFFDEAHNPVFRIGISGDAAIRMVQFWQQIDPDTGTLRHDFTDPDWNTRFLGDIYQDLSEATRKRYALLQTPEFVEEFILDRTLTPAINEFGYREVRMIDPACGSGHFLLGGFHRLVGIWAKSEPGRNRRDLAQRALAAVAGIDLNPFAVAIARFRLLVAALHVSETLQLSGAPNFKIDVAIGDSLLHGTRFGLTVSDDMFDVRDGHVGTKLEHAYASEDLDHVNSILGKQYHAVVGNPPYIVVKDSALNSAYRDRYNSCHMQYSLGAPFTERIFELALSDKNGTSAGFVGLITANSFMKREFGSKLIEQVLPKLDLTHVVDTSGAYIPGHGTPTVIIFGRHRAPIGTTIRVVMGINGEPSAPPEPKNGLVWSAILDQIDHVGSESSFVGVADFSRDVLGHHPWSIGGGGASDLQSEIERSSTRRLSGRYEVVGGTGRTSADDALIVPNQLTDRARLEPNVVRPLIEGDQIRDWSLRTGDSIITPYSASDGLIPIESVPGLNKWLWQNRTVLGSRVTFGRATYFEEGRPWWCWHQITPDRLSYVMVISFAELATHNHFVLDRGGKVFKQSSPIITLPSDCVEEEAIGLAGLLNSSVACFWLKQVCFNKGNGGIGGGISDEKWELRYSFNSSQVSEFPLPDSLPSLVACAIDLLSRNLNSIRPSELVENFESGEADGLTRRQLDTAKVRYSEILGEMVSLQEELDWGCYSIYGLLPASEMTSRVRYSVPPRIQLGERAFEIVLARRVASGEEKTAWFERHGSKMCVEIPAHWPEEYREVVRRRIELIESDRNIGMLERPEYKRRWNLPAWDELEIDALRKWLLDALEFPKYWPRDRDRVVLHSIARIAEIARKDADFLRIMGLYAGHDDFDLEQVLSELMADESVPFLPILRYTESGIRKRASWEKVWSLQRQQDVAEYSDEISPPPKYKNADFIKTSFWRLRGGLDVAKERWISYPGCERGADGSLVLAWAGWDHLQQAIALAAYYLDMKDNEGWDASRLVPLLAGLLELLPWLKQWHNEYNAADGARMGDYFEGFVMDEAKALGCTADDLRGWVPDAPVRRARRARSAT